MNFELFLEKTVKSQTTKNTYIQALKKLNNFLKNDEFIHGGAYLDEVKNILIQETEWKYDLQTKKIYKYREKFQEKNPFLKTLENVENLSIEDLEKLKKLTVIDGNPLIRAISKADGNGAISASIGKLIEWKKNEELKDLQLEFWDKLREVYTYHKISKQHEKGIDIKFGEEYHIYIVHLNNKNLITLKLYIPDNKKLFKKYMDQKLEIEKELGGVLEWNLKESSATTISKNFSFNIYDKKSWLKTLEILSNEISNFIKTFKKYQKGNNLNFEEKKEDRMEYQRIIYGAPGTGKSYMLSEESEDKFNKDKIERVTFYDGYTYGQFVGTYKPVPSDMDSENIVYKYIPGPLMTTLVKALQNPGHKFLLIIEEINRAKADRVFGNIFQLLDRDKDGKSEYPIAISTEVEKYLKEQFEDDNQYQEYFGKGLILPNNLYIWATMNNADQGVYPLDTAFKRRWSFEYVGLDDNAEKFGEAGKEYCVHLKFENDNDIKKVSKYIPWNEFRETLNEFLLENGINEDRLIAPFFINSKQFSEDVDKNETTTLWINEAPYLNKLLMYIFDDVLKHKISVRKRLFTEDILSFSQLIKKYKTGECIYSEEFLDKLNIEEQA